MSDLLQEIFELTEQNLPYIRYEKGEREPVISLLTVIADYFDVSADYLLGRSDQRK